MSTALAGSPRDPPHGRKKKKKGRWSALSFEHYFSRDGWEAIQRWAAFGLVPKVSGNILYSYPEKDPNDVEIGIPQANMTPA